VLALADPYVPLQKLSFRFSSYIMQEANEVFSKEFGIVATKKKKIEAIANP